MSSKRYLEKPENCTRLITINTWKGDGNYEWRRQLMATQLYQLQPDIICLQESLQSEDGRFDTGVFLADFLGLNLVYGRARLKNRIIGSASVMCYSGLAILCAYEVSHHWLTTIPTSAEDPERLALTALLHKGEHHFTITNLHLTHIGERDDLRLKQLESIIKQNGDAALQSAWFCCGDFNCSLDQERLHELEEECGYAISDCYLEGGGKLPGGTLVDSSRAEDKSRIDHILQIHLNNERRVSCSNARVVLDTPDFEGCYPSDHFGVCVDINFTEEN